MKIRMMVCSIGLSWALFGMTGCGAIVAMQQVEQAQAQQAQWQAQAAEQQKALQAQALKVQQDADQRRQSWNVHTEKSALDDSLNVLAGKYAEASFRDRWGDAQLPTLLVRCEEGKPRFGIIVHAKFNHDAIGSTYKSVAMTVRFDEAPPQEIQAAIGVDRKSAYVPDAVSAIKRARTSERIVVKFTPAGREAVVATFKVGDIEPVVGKMSGSCQVD